MVVTITLVFVLCAMTGAAMWVSATTRHSMILGMLPWNLADWFAMVWAEPGPNPSIRCDHAAFPELIFPDQPRRCATDRLPAGIRSR